MNFNGIRIGTSWDSVATVWYNAVVAAGSSVTKENMTAVNAFVKGCKVDGTWSAIKSSCLLCAADTLAGALVPLAGVAPTNNGFVAGDYSRTTGLKGNASTKYLSSNYAANESPQNNWHMACYVKTAPSTGVTQAFMGETTLTLDQLLSTSSAFFTRCRANAGYSIAGQYNTLGLKGVARSTSGSYSVRTGGSTTSQTQTSSTPSSAAISVFARGSTGLIDARLSFYSIGESLDLALLDARLTTLMASLT